ncbi:MAG: hypothetical protein IT518_01755 [Burkholderiales bacterium]|nr:hypothetical protein [Burkholderiales bacterium]
MSPRWIAAMLAFTASLALAQYPDHPVTMIVPFPPGGVADTVARPVAEAMGRDFRQPVVIENKPGAGGGIGMAQAAKAKPDGYTVLMALASLTVLPEADKIRVLAHWGDVRLVTLPDVPSLKEAGTDVQYAQWSGLFVSAGTPDAVVARLREAARAAANDPKVKEVLLMAGSPVQYLDAPEFQRYVDADAAKMAEAVKRIGKVE